MFDLIAGREKHLPSHATVPLLLSTSAQASVIALIFALPLLFMTERLPEVPTMMAFVADMPAPPPPPPPPPAAAKPKQATPKPEAAVQQNQFIAPLEEPAEIAALPEDEGSDTGVLGGVEGGIPGGVVGGVVGGLPEAPPPPPPRVSRGTRRRASASRGSARCASSCARGLAPRTCRAAAPR